MYASVLGNGVTLKTKNESDGYVSNDGFDAPYLYSSVTYDEQKGEVVAFVANRSLGSDMELDIDLDGFDSFSLCEHIEIYSDDLNATNTAECEAVKPSYRKVTGKSSAVLKKHSWNVLIFRK